MTREVLDYLKSLCPRAACGVKLRDTAECNSALLFGCGATHSGGSVRMRAMSGCLRGARGRRPAAMWEARAHMNQSGVS
jgi:hypothetical protein